ncbi:MAG: AAA family ATPase [Candidatus Nanoarchaeia archaeon]|nr:AAA family ATPase [Candidatus Nanoarchaeia archaeon]
MKTKKYSNFFLKEEDVDETFFSISPYHFKKLKLFIENYKKSSKEIIMIYGPSGVGKTFLVHYLAKKYNMELYEINPSNSLNKNDIHKTLEQAIKQISLFGNDKLIFIDEIDNFSSRYDRGYLQEILKISKDSNFPIIVTVNDLYNTKLSTFRAKVEKCEIQVPNKITLNKIVKKIEEKNDFKLPENVKESLISKSQGDIRALMTDIFVFYCFKDEESEYDEILKDFFELSLRKKDETIYESLKILTNKSQKDFSSIQDMDEQWDNLELWIEENMFRINKMIDSKSFWNMFEYISTSDIFLSRIMRYQSWRYLVYVSYFLTSGVNTSIYNSENKYVAKRIKQYFNLNDEILEKKIKESKEIIIDKVEFPKYILEMSRTMRSRALFKSIVEKIQENSHQSKTRIREDFRYYASILKNDKKMRELYEIDDIEYKFLLDF